MQDWSRFPPPWVTFSLVHLVSEFVPFLAWKTFLLRTLAKHSGDVFFFSLKFSFHPCPPTGCYTVPRPFSPRHPQFVLTLFLARSPSLPSWRDRLFAFGQGRRLFFFPLGCCWFRPCFVHDDLLPTCSLPPMARALSFLSASGPPFVPRLVFAVQGFVDLFFFPGRMFR